MRKMIEVAALRLTLSLGTLGWATVAQAQDPEEGAVDLNETSSPAAEAPRSAPAWEDPTGGSKRDDEDEPEDEPKEKQVGPGKLRIFVGPRIGVGGGFRPKGQDLAYLTQPTPGAQLGADYVLHKYFALGLETRLGFAVPKNSDGFSYLVWDLALKPRVLYRIKVAPVEIYLALPGGLNVNKPGKKFKKDLNNPSLLTQEEGKLSGTVGLMGGASYFFNDSWALNAELGWLWTFLSVKTRLRMPAPVGTGAPERIFAGDVHYRLGQLHIALNALYAF